MGALVLLLIVFPAASWYYLNSGLQYRRSAMAELQDYGNFPLSSWIMADGSPLAAGYLEKKMLVANILPTGPDGELVAQYGQTLQQLHDQFDERDELLFVTVLHGDSAQVAQQFDNFTQTYQLTDKNQQLFVQLDDAAYRQLDRGLFHPENAGDQSADAFLLLTDTTATIRRYYDVRQSHDIKRLVEHIALLLPLKKDRELIFKREVEK